MSANNPVPGSIEYYKAQLSSSKKSSQQQAEDDARKKLAQETFQTAQSNAQRTSLETGRSQNVADFIAPAREQVEQKYTISVTPGYGLLGGGSRVEVPSQRTLSVPVRDESAEDAALKVNYSAFQRANTRAQGQQIKASLQQRNMERNGQQAAQNYKLDRSQLTPSQLSFVRQQEAGGLSYAGEIQINKTTGDLAPLFYNTEDVKKSDAIKAANERSTFEYNSWVRDMQSKGFGGLVETKDASGKTSAKFTTFTSGSKTVAVNPDGTFTLPDDPLKDVKLKTDTAEQVWRFGVESFGAAGAGLVNLGGSLIGKAEDALGFKEQADRTRNNSAAAAAAIKEHTDLGAFSYVTENVGRAFGSDQLYAESGKALRDKKIIDAQGIPTGSVIGLGVAYGVKGLENAGIKKGIEDATGLQLGQGDKAIAEQYKALQERPVEFIGGTIADIATLGNPVKFAKGATKIAQGLKLTRSVEKEAQTAAKRAGVEGDVSVRPIEQRKIPATGEVVDIPLQPTKFANVAVANRSLKIPLIGGKKIDLGIMQGETPIASIRVPESISVKKLTLNPTREVVTQEGNPVGIISPKSNTAIIQNPSPLPLASKAELVGQDLKSVTEVQDTAEWLKAQTKLPSAEELKLKGTDPYFHSPKIQAMIESYALKNDFTLNSKSAKLSKKLEPLYAKADNLRTEKEALQSQVVDIDNQISTVSNKSKATVFGIDSVDSAATNKEIADLTGQKADVLQKISDIDEKLTGVQSEISSTSTAFGIRRADALGSLQRASNFFYKVGGRGRNNPARGGAPPDVMFPKVQNAPKSSNLIARSTTDVYNLEKNPALPSARLSRLAGYDLAKQGEGLTPDGEFFLGRSGKATKLKKQQVATDVEFDLKKVGKFVKENTKRSKAVGEEARSKKPSTPFTFDVEPAKASSPIDIMPSKGEGKLIEVGSAKEAPSFASVKNSIFDAEQAAKVRGLGLRGNAASYINSGVLGLGGLTGAERMSKKKNSQGASESTDYIRYPGENLGFKSKGHSRTEDLLNLGSLVETANPFNFKPQRSGLDVANPFSHGTGSKTGGKTDIITTPRNFTSTGSRIDQGTITDLNFRLETTTGRPPRTPPTIRRTPPFTIPKFEPGVGITRSQGSKGAGLSSYKQRAVRNPFINKAFDIEAGSGKGGMGNKAKGNKKRRGLLGGGLL